MHSASSMQGIVFERDGIKDVNPLDGIIFHTKPTTHDASAAETPETPPHQAPRNIDVWRAHAAKKKAAGEPFWSTKPRAPAASFEEKRRGASLGPPSSSNPFDNDSAFASKELIAEWTDLKEIGNAHVTAKEYKEAAASYMETLKTCGFIFGGESGYMREQYPHPDDTKVIDLYTDLLGNLAESWLRFGKLTQKIAKKTGISADLEVNNIFEMAANFLAIASKFDNGHVKNNIRFVRAQLGIPGRVIANELMRICLYSLTEEEGRESKRIKKLIYKCRRRFEDTHWKQLGMVKGAGPNELLIPGVVADGKQANGQIHDTHIAGSVFDARFALGMALEMNQSEPEIARRAEDLRLAESHVEKILGKTGLLWDSPEAYDKNFPDINKTQYLPGFLESEDCGPVVSDGVHIISGTLM